MKKNWMFIFGALLVILVLLFFCIRSLPDGKLHVFVLDVGQGDSILIQLPTGERILVDGGPDDKVIQRLSEVMPFYERNIDVILLTHPHADHVNGLNDLLKRYHVMQVIITGVDYKYPGYTEFLNLISREGAQVIFAGALGLDYKIGTAILDMLYPIESFQGRLFNNYNNGSIVFRLLYGQRKFFFGGDMELEEEKNLMAVPGRLGQGLDLRADFYKVGHHGSRTSSSETLLDLIKPEYAAISCGIDNTFKHPHPETIQHLQARRVTIFRTDLDGTIEAVSDGQDLNVLTVGKQ